MSPIANPRLAFRCGTIVLGAFLAIGVRPAQAHAQQERRGVGAHTAPRRRAEADPSYVVLPYPFFTPETRLAFGLGAFAILPTEPRAGRDRSSLLESNVVVSIDKQALIGARTSLFSGNRDWLLLSDTVGRIHWPDRFYPLGNDAGSEQFERWTNRGIRAWAQLLGRVSGPLYAGLLAEAGWMGIEAREDRFLTSPNVPGNTDHHVVGLGVAWRIDHRDRALSPRRGGLYSAHWTAFDATLGSDFDFTRFELDLRYFFPTWGEHVVALRLFAGFETGNPPFTWMERIGGFTRLRGIYATRYLDRHGAYALVEYRLPLFWRLGAVAFVGTGQVGHDLDDFGFSELHMAGGGGLRLRIAPEDPMNISFDVAATEGSVNAYFGIGESF